MRTAGEEGSAVVLLDDTAFDSATARVAAARRHLGMAWQQEPPPLRPKAPVVPPSSAACAFDF
jgi:hypothetical protein